MPAADLTALQKDVIAKLVGQTEIRSGLKLSNRAAPENKQAARADLPSQARPARFIRSAASPPDFSGRPASSAG
jgi:hypothetical protein